MTFPLNEFEQHIDETILVRGLSYFKAGHVREPDILSAGNYEFIVEGTENYTVNISLSKNTVNDHSCDCPFDMGPICKHVAAAIFYLQKDVLEITAEPKSSKSKSSKSKPKKKRKTIADQVNELLDQVSYNDLQDFIREHTEKDRAFRNMFLASFAHLNNSETAAMYKKQIQSLLKSAADRRGFIHWSAMSGVNAAVNQLLVTAKNQLESGNVQSAFNICTAVMEKMSGALNYADDSSGSLSGAVEYGFDIFRQLAQMSDNESVRKQILDYCYSAFDDKIYDGWDWHIAVLEISGQLVKTEEEIQRVFEQIESVARSGYEKEKAQSIKYDVLLKTRGEKEANAYLDKHLSNPMLRRTAIQLAMDGKDFDRANTLAQDRISHDMKKAPGLAKEWYDWLLKIAQAQGNTEKVIEYARYLLLDNFMNKQDYYQILKDSVEPNHWPEFIEKIVEELESRQSWLVNGLITKIYIKEQWWDRLFQMVKNNPDLRSIQEYESYLLKDYGDEIYALYEAGVVKYMDEAVGRKHYQNACRYLKRMIKMAGREKVNGTISMLREKYPTRRALMEELDKL